MEKQKRVNITPTAEGFRRIKKAVEILKSKGEKVSVTSFCHDASIEAADNVIKNSN